MRVPIVALAIVASLFAPPGAVRAESAPEDVRPEIFGDEGQLVLSARTQVLLGTLATSRRALPRDSSLSVGRTSETGSASVLAVSIGADYFLLDGLSLGGSLALGKEEEILGLGGSARAGYDLPLCETFSIWGRAELSYARWGKGNGSPGVLQKLDAGASVSLLYHPATHFFVGLGPMIVRGIYAHSSDAAATRATDLVTAVGAQSVIGGWFDL
jgi:hypothetical protein